MASPLLLDTHKLNAEDAVEAIQTLDATTDDLLAILKHEQERQPRARRQVIEALEDRIGEVEDGTAAGAPPETPDPVAHQTAGPVTPPIMEIPAGTLGSDDNMAPGAIIVAPAGEAPPVAKRIPAKGDVIFVEVGGQTHEAIVSHREMGVVANIKDGKETAVFARPEHWSHKG